MSVELARKHAIATDESISFFFSFLNFRGEYKLMRNFFGFFFSQVAPSSSGDSTGT